MRVLIVPEDPVNDGYILRPVVGWLFEELGKQARIAVLQDPRMRGVDEALSKDALQAVVNRYPMVDLFLVLVDRDGDEGRENRGAAREAENPRRLYVCLGVEEIEVWMLALHLQKVPASWAEVRAEPNPKERFAEPFLKSHAPRGSIGRGRAWAMRELDRRQFGALLARCPELRDLKGKIAARLAAS